MQLDPSKITLEFKQITKSESFFVWKTIVKLVGFACITIFASLLTVLMICWFVKYVKRFIVNCLYGLNWNKHTWGLKIINLLEEPETP